MSEPVYSPIFTVLKGTGLPCAYSHFATPQEPPYLVYIGNGQNTFAADNTHYWRENQYQIEYYYTLKDETKEDAIETSLLSNGYIYEKSEDYYLEDEGLFLIYYYV